MMHGRKGRERRDSVTVEILKDRQRHQELLKSEEVLKRIPSELLLSLEKAGLGSKRRKGQVYTKSSFGGGGDQCSTIAGAGGSSLHLTSAASDWPVFEHVLPEVAFAGHSNSGKSTLVNAVAGILPRMGPASVSDRAGWTDLVCFYQLGKKPPVLIMADLPGYGHAVASTAEKKAWKLMIRDYLQSRIVLSLCCVLVDCTRGLCDEDKRFIKFLHKHGIKWQVVLTKADLLDSLSLAASVVTVRDDLCALGVLQSLTTDDRRQETEDRVTSDFDMIRPVSASTGAGVNTLWRDLLRHIDSSIQPQGAQQAVREHVMASRLREIMSNKRKHKN